MNKYLWHSSSIKILNGVGLSNFITQIDGEHYISSITKSLVSINKLITYNNIENISTIINKKDIEQWHKEGISNEDIMLYYLLKDNTDLKVMVAGNTVMAKFSSELLSRRIKLFSVLKEIDFFKQVKIAKLLAKAPAIKENYININLISDDDFNYIKNIALGQQRG